MISVDERDSMSTARYVWITFVLCLCLGAVVAGMSSLYTGAADIARATGASQTELTWIIDAYTLGLAGLLLPSGALGDRYGRRGLMIVGLVLYIVGSGMALVVDTPMLLITVRALTGVAAALVMPSTLSLITTLLPIARRERSVAIWSAVFASSGGVGIIGCGALLEFFSWRSIFWFLGILGVVALLASFTIPTSKDTTSPPLDVLGALMGAISVSTAVFGLIEAGNQGWSNPLIISSIAVGILTGALFILIELRSPHPVLDVRLFLIRPFGAGAFGAALLFAAVFGLFYLSVIYMQYILGYSTLVAGLAPFAVGFGAVAIALYAAPLTRRFGLNVVVAGGAMSAMITFFMLMQTDTDTSFWYVIAAMVVFGGGTGVAMAPCTSAIVDNVAEDKQGVASAVNHTSREFGAALGVALVGSVLSAGYTSGMTAATADLPGPAREAARDSLPGAVAVADQLGPNGAPLVTAARDAFMDGAHDTYLALLIIMAIGAVILYFWAPGKAAANVSAFRGVVRDGGARPLKAATLTLIDAGGRQLGKSHTDENGRYVLHTTDPGRHLLVCTATGRAPKATLVELNGSSNEHDMELDAAASPGHVDPAIEGVIQTAAGGPFAAAVVTAHDVDGNEYPVAHCGVDGGFRFDGLPSGDYVLSASVRYECRDRVEILGATEIDHRIHAPAAQLAVRVESHSPARPDTPSSADVGSPSSRAHS